MTGQAVVVGGGIAGLLAAHALLDLYDHVTLLERHAYPAPTAVTPAPPSRRGVPQSRCLHMLMAAGAAAFDDLLPGWRTDIVARGALPFDVSADAAIHLDAGWMVRTRSGITAYACSRALLEAMLRDRLAAHPRATLRENARVLGLITSADGGRVTGLRLAGQDGAIDADLVVDASGRHSALPDWLRQLPGAGAPIEDTVIPSGTHYVSRWFHLPPGHAPDWQCLSMSVDPASHRSAMMLRAEGEFWGVVLLGDRGDPLPIDDGSFLAFAAGLADGALHAVLRHATPVSPIHRYAPSANRLRHAERHAGWPTHLIALGDSVCALDPFFGLGMTAAARAWSACGTIWPRIARQALPSSRRCVARLRSPGGRRPGATPTAAASIATRPAWPAPAPPRCATPLRQGRSSPSSTCCAHPRA